MYVLRIRLKEILKERGMTQRDLHTLTGVREAYISEIANDNRTTLNRENLAKIIQALNITDMNQLFRVVEVTEDPRS